MFSALAAPSGDPCDNNGGCNQNCTSDGKTAICSCAVGYRLSPDGKTCQGIEICHN